MLAVAVIGLCWLLGLHIQGLSAAPPDAPACPIHLQIALEKPTFAFWEIAAGSVSISNHDRRAVPSTVVVALFRGGRLFHRREVSLDIQPGRKTYDLTTALGFAPLISPKESLVGDWRLQVESRSRDCIVSGEATFKVKRSASRRAISWRGLVGYWLFDDGQGVLAADWSGSGHDAEVLGAGWADGKFHKALAFNGQSTVVKLWGVQAPGPKGMTVLFWIWPDGTGSPFQTVVARPVASRGQATEGWAFVLKDGRPFLEIWGGDGTSRLGFQPGLGQLPSRAWSHVALTRDGRTLTLYLNGRSVGSLSAPLVDAREADIFLGRAEFGQAATWFKGRLDELKVFDRALSPDEVQADYEAAAPVPLEVFVDPGTRIGEIDPMIYGVNVEGNNPFTLPGGLGISNVRWPGGCFAEAYHWRKAVGPAQGRRVRGAASCEGDQMSESPARADVGSDEFMAILQRGGVVPLLTTNFATGTAQEAANWVEYMNGESPGLSEGIRRGWAPDTYRGGDKAPPGYFAWLRERFGHPRPYGVKYWAVGNEFEARSTPSWTRDVKQYYRGGVGKGIGHLMTRDPTRTDWSLDQRIGTGQPSAEFFAPFVPVVPGSERVEVLPVLRREPLELGPPVVWDPVPRVTAAGRKNVYQLLPQEGKIIFGEGVAGNVLPKEAVVRITYTSGPHDGFIEFARRMKAVDPTIRVGTSAAFSEIPPETAKHVDFVAANLYPSLTRNDPDPVRRYYRIQAAPVAEFETYIRRAQEYLRRSFPGMKIQLAMTEYNFSLDSPHMRSLASTLFVADMLRVFATHGISIANYYSLEFLRGRDAKHGEVSPPGLMFGLLHDHFGRKLIATQRAGVPSFSGDFDGQKIQFPFLEVLGSVGEGGQRVYLLIINKHAERPFALAVQVAGEEDHLGGRLFQLWGEHPFAEDVLLITRAIQGRVGLVRVIVPPHSVSVLEIGRGGVNRGTVSSGGQGQE